LYFLGLGALGLKMAYNNNFIQVCTFGNDDVTIININKLKTYFPVVEIVIIVGAITI
jgi:hypothetical protein